MLIVMPVAIKAHLHNVCAKNNYELLIAQEPAENARSNGGVGGRGRCLQDGCSCAQMEGQHWIIAQKNRSEEPCAQIPGSTGTEESISTAQKHFPLPNETDMYTLVLFFSPLCLALLLFIFADGEMEGIFGSYLDNSHIFPSPPRALEEEALVALPLSQSGTQLCASHSAQHYLVSAAASLGLSETKSSQSQLSLLLNSSLFSVMHLLELF